MLYNERLTYTSTAGTVVFALSSSVSPFWLTAASGIDGLINDVFTFRGAGQDGDTELGSSIQARYITIEGLILVNRWQARRELLRVINPKYDGTLVYTDGSITRYIRCKVTQAPVISKAALPEFQLSLRCPYPFWRDGDGSAQHLAEIAHWMPALMFDADAGLEIPEDGLEFGTRSSSLIAVIPNTGDVPASVLVEFRALADVSNPSITNVYTQEALSLTINMQPGDVIRVATGRGVKRAELTREGVTGSIYSAVDRDSTWLQLAVGDNLLRYDASITDNLEVTIYYDLAYVGV